MNVRPDMLRTQGIPQLTPQMMGMNSQQFLATQQQPGQQQQSFGLIAGAVNPVNPSIGSLPGQPTTSMLNVPRGAEFQMQLNQQQRRAQMLLQSRDAQAALNQGGGGPSTHFGAMNQNQLQNMGFPSNMIPQGNNSQLRRVSSQPQPLNQAGGHLGGMLPDQQSIGAMGAAMNSAGILPAQLRQNAQQQQQLSLRLQQQQQHHQQRNQMQGHMSPQMTMLNRQGNLGMPQTARSASAQLMSSFAQPPQLAQSHSGQNLQNNFQSAVSLPLQHQPQMSSSPRPGQLPQSHTSANLPHGASQGPTNRNQLTPDNALFNFPNSQFQPVPHNVRGLTNSGLLPFVPSSTPPNQPGGDLSQSMLVNSTNPTRQGSFSITPAQQYDQMQQPDGFGPPFSMPPPQNGVPSRPPSHNSHHPTPTIPQQQHPSDQRSPQQVSAVNHLSHMQRPQSQPQSHSGQPAQAGPPRPQPQSLPTNSLPAQGRVASMPAQGQSSMAQAPPPLGQPITIVSRHPTQNSVASVSGSSSSQPPSEGPQPQNSLQQRQLMATASPIGFGQGLIRMLQFSGTLAIESKNKLNLSYWESMVKDFFTPKAIMKFTLWKDSKQNEAKPFDIGVPILPRFFLVTTQSGVKSMNLSLDGARERLVTANHAVVECVSAVWTYKYSNGYTITLRGPLTAHILIVPGPPGGPNNAGQGNYVLKFDQLQFDGSQHEKFIALDAVVGMRVVEPSFRNPPTLDGISALQQEDEKLEEPRISYERASIPCEPVNAFGIPQATMRCLELAESVGAMTDLIAYANETKLGPLVALSRFASNIRDATLTQNSGPPIPAGPTSFLGVSPAVTLYSSVPPPPPPLANPQIASSDSPQLSSADNSPQKQNKTTPKQTLGASSSTPAPAPPSTPTAGPSSSNNTPSMTNAQIGTNALKRKQTDAASPTITNSEQNPPKRAVRKRKMTGAGS